MPGRPASRRSLLTVPTDFIRETRTFHKRSKFLGRGPTSLTPLSLQFSSQVDGACGDAYSPGLRSTEQLQKSVTEIASHSQKSAWLSLTHSVSHRSSPQLTGTRKRPASDWTAPECRIRDGSGLEERASPVNSGRARCDAPHGDGH